MNKKAKVITLFSGVGMQELGFETAGLDYELINYCEFEPKPAKGFALFHDCSEDLNLGDITKVDEKEYFNELKDAGNGDIDIMISSFPCQAFSAAGSRKGFSDPTRGTLFYDTMRLANEIKPSVLIFENVKGLTNHDGGNTLKQIEKKVKDSDYIMFYQILNSVNYDIPQNRERWFAVCIRKDLFTKDFYFPQGKMTTKSISDYLEKGITDRKKTARMTPILQELMDGTRPLVKYRSNVGLKKVYDGIKQGDFKGGFTRTGIFSIYGTSSTLIKPNEHHFLEINGRLTPKERMRLMGVDDVYTDRLIDDGFSEREIDAIAGNGLVVNVFDKLITEVYKYMKWIPGTNDKTIFPDKKKSKKKKDLVETTEPNCETEYEEDIQLKKKIKLMRLTEQQALVMFDLTKTAMNTDGGFAGYSNKELMTLINDIISQQDNTEMIELVEIKSEEVKSKKKKVKKVKKDVVDIVETPKTETEDVIEQVVDDSKNSTFEIKIVEEAVEDLLVETISEDLPTEEETEDFW